MDAALVVCLSPILDLVQDGVSPDNPRSTAWLNEPVSKHSVDSSARPGLFARGP